MKVPRICIIGLEDYGVLTGETSTAYVGGETVQHVLLARAWRDLGFAVSIIVWDHGQGEITEVEGLRLISAYRRDDGVPGLRLLHPKTTSMLRAMRTADADIYYQSLSGFNTGLTAWFCRHAGRRFVFRISSDAYCVPGRQLIRFWRDRKIYEYGLRRANLVLAQTQYQQELLRENYGLTSELWNMAVEPPPPSRPRLKDIDVLWVSNFRPVKRPELVVALAERLPNVGFTVAGGGAPAEIEWMRAAAARLSNLDYRGPVAYSKVGELFDSAKLSLNTSSLEGFPNTFLQAWIRGVPVVTFFDPDGLVEKAGLGATTLDLDGMEAAIRALLRDDEQRRIVGERAAAFAAENFSMSAVAQRSAELFSQHFGADFATSRLSLAATS